jgi:RNA polymerase sigma-70 factor (ECF subfamily)
MADNSPLGFGEVPTAAARLVIVLLPVANGQPADGIRGDAPIIVALPQPGTRSGSRGATVADPEFATCYQAEMPPLISFLIKCGAEPDDAPETAQDAFRELFEQWTRVDEPKLWLRKVAFPRFLRRPVRNAGSPEESHGAPTSPGASARFDFGEQERLFIALTRLLPTTQRAVLALHIERLQTRREHLEAASVPCSPAEQRLAAARSIHLRGRCRYSNRTPAVSHTGSCAAEPGGRICHGAAEGGSKQSPGFAPGP